MGKIFDGKKLRDQLLGELKTLVQKKNLKPRLEIVLVGENPASLAYIKQKIKAGQEVGAEVNLNQFPEKISQREVLKKIGELNQNPQVNGIIVQFPLPKKFDSYLLTQAVAAEKDVDGLNEKSTFKPATPLAVLKILESKKTPIKGKTVVIFGQSRLVGAPLKALFEEKEAVVIPVDIDTPSPKNLSLKADILVSAVGKAGLITAAMVKPETIVIDVGISRNSKTGKLEGDVDFEKVKDKASLITPVPGGVGPMTVAMLIANLVTATSH